MTFLIRAIIVMIVTFIIDVIYAKYYMELANKNALKASLWGSSMYLFSAFVVVNYTQDHGLVIPAVIGAFLGTYVTVKYFNK